MNCRNCGELIDEKTDICPKCGARNKNVIAKKKSPGVAAIASFFIPGLGQIYSGEVRKGIGFLIIGVSFFSIGLFMFLGHRMIGPLLVAGAAYILFWIYNIYDAYKIAEPINSNLNDVRNLWNQMHGKI